MTGECPARMPGTDSLRLVDQTECHLGTDLPPERIEAIHDALTSDWLVRSIGYADTVYLVVGNYDEQTKPRLLDARDALDRRSPAHTAFLLDEVDPEADAWQNFYVKFKVFAARSDWLVGVFEDNDGGHELEVGEVSPEKLFVFKREYEDRETERAAYDAMIAGLFEVLESEGRLVRWSSPLELPPLVEEHVP